MGTGPGTGSLSLNITTAVVSFAVAGLIFRVGWKASAERIWRFNSFAEVNKADWSARINSTVHAAVVCVLVLVCLLTMSFDPKTLVPLGSTTLLEITFSISIGYFLFDLGVILWWMLPMWTVFVLHHVVALKGQYVLLLFLLVEASTVPLNAMAFLEDLGRRRSAVHRFAHGVMYALWFVFRFLLPIYLLVLIWTKVVQKISSEEACLIPSMVCAHIIALFCIGVFCFVLTPEVYSRLRYGDKDEPAIDAVLAEGVGGVGRGPGDAAASSIAMEMGEGGGGNGESGRRSPGAAGGAYHDLESAAAAPMGPLSPKRTIISVAREGPTEIAKAVREGLLPHGDDEGGPGHTGADRSSAGQMR